MLLLRGRRDVPRADSSKVGVLDREVERGRKERKSAMKVERVGNKQRGVEEKNGRQPKLVHEKSSTPNQHLWK